MMPRIETTLIEGLPGAKGAGEIACVPPMACVANAIFNATGVRVTMRVLNLDQRPFGAPMSNFHHPIL